MDPRTGLDDVKNRNFLALLELFFRPLSLPTSIQSLYRLRCSRSPCTHIGVQYWNKYGRRGPDSYDSGVGPMAGSAIFVSNLRIT
jgi:hypothetical protein